MGAMTTTHPLRVAYLGNDAWSVPPLEAIAASAHHVATVVTRVPRPGRRGAGDAPTPVADAARRLRLPLVEVETVRTGEGFEALARAASDVLVVVAYGEILPPSVLALPTVAPINLHFSLLPALRGASPVRTALRLGLDETGVTTMVMDEGLDTGDVLLQAREPIRDGDDAGTLGDRLARVGGDVLVRTLDALSADSAPRIPQDDANATYTRKLTSADRRIDWTQPAEDIVNLVRALAPDPAATATFRDAGLKVFRARAVEGAGPPGVVLDIGRDGVVVAAGQRAVRILELAPAGRSRMTADDFVNGFHPAAGERLS
jgi:methionyl-tRNA formyltransferase